MLIKCTCDECSVINELIERVSVYLDGQKVGYVYWTLVSILGELLLQAPEDISRDVHRDLVDFMLKSHSTTFGTNPWLH